MLGKSLYLGEQIELSAIDAEKDAALFSQWSEQRAFNSHFTYGIFRPVAEHEMKKKLEELLKKIDEKRNAYFFVVRKREGSEPIGLAWIRNILHAHQVGSIHVDFGSDADLVKYGSEAMDMMLRYGFMEASLHRLDAALAGYETEMISLYESKGFLREVQRREAAYHAGRYWDEMIYAILKPEYKKRIEEAAK
jgi:RimJ/RimL family protein N-acetyltransferase